MQDDNGAPFFYNTQTDKSQYAHPMDDYFRTLYHNLKSVGQRYGKVSEEELRLVRTKEMACRWWNQRDGMSVVG